MVVQVGTLQLSRSAHRGAALVELEAAECDQAAVQVLEPAAGPGEQEARGASPAWDAGLGGGRRVHGAAGPHGPPATFQPQGARAKPRAGRKPEPSGVWRVFIGVLHRRVFVTVG